MATLETTTGGRALKFYASVRMDVRRTETLKQGGEMVGNHTKVKVVKNKVAPPFKQAEFDIMFGTGISREGEILDLAAECNVVNKSGAWYSYNGERIGQGRENVKVYLKDHPEICEEIGEAGKNSVSSSSGGRRQLRHQARQQHRKLRQKNKTYDRSLSGTAAGTQEGTPSSGTYGQDGAGLADRLKQAGFSEKATEDAVSYVRELGYINDERYAFHYIMYRIHNKSRQKIFQELQQKGVDRQTIQSAWEEAEELETPDEHALLVSLIEKKYPADSELDEREMRRLMGYFARRGFRQGEITSALEELNITFCVTARR